GAYSGTAPTALFVFPDVPDSVYVIEAFSAYAQDTWRAGRGITVTYGFRWEVDPAPRSVTPSTIINGLANGFANLKSSSPGYYVPAGKRLFETSWWNFAPRLGMGWQILDGPARRTVLRVGAGRFFDLGQEGFESSGYHAANAMTYTQQPLGSLTGGS